MQTADSMDSATPLGIEGQERERGGEREEASGLRQIGEQHKAAPHVRV